jgi:hypothetical protein
MDNLRFDRKILCWKEVREDEFLNPYGAFLLRVLGGNCGLLRCHCRSFGAASFCPAYLIAY